jgi:glycosyltransferase involved in cell wall biosynthesis
MAPLVSVVLATFNRLQYLRPTIESVFAQTLTDWELLIADDGSSSPTREYLESLIEPGRTNVLFFEHTGNPSKLRNAAVRAARGEYVAFQDSDDLWLPRKLELQIGSLRDHPTRRWSHTRYVFIDAHGELTPWMLRTGGWPTPDGWVIDKLVRVETVIALPSVVVARSLLQKVGGFDEQLLGSEDYDLWRRLALESEIDAVTSPVTLVRRHGGEHFATRGAEVFHYARLAAEKSLRMRGLEHLSPLLRQQRAMTAAGLARAHGASGNRRHALTALPSALKYAPAHPSVWLTVLETIALICAPAAVRRLARRLRIRYSQAK